MRRPLLTLVAATLLATAWPAHATAQGERYALLVAGASGDPELAVLHRTWMNNLVSVLRERYKFDAAHMTVLVETPQAGEDRSTAANVRTALAKFAKEAKTDDLLFVMLIGHGGGAGVDAKFNLVGPDLTVVEWNDLLKPIGSRIAVVNSSSASFPYIEGLKAPNRIVITATSRGGQVFHPMFADAFIKALNAEPADSDKNGRLSLLEVFVYASRLVTQHYERDGKLATEHAVFDDTGDGTARDAEGTGTDGDVAGLTYLDAVTLPTSSDPEIQKLLVRQQTLTQQIDDLRKRRQSMPSAEFDQQFETIIIELSLVSRELRTKGK